MKQIAKQNAVFLIAIALLLLIWGLYLSTAATGIVPGDPTEYTFVAHLLGIAHPPGYAFMTLVTKLWQTLVPLGTIAQRSHWLATLAGALTAILVYGSVWQITSLRSGSIKTSPGLAILSSAIAAASVAMAADHWQHSIHVNSHIVTVTLNALAIFTLLRWWRSGRDRWLYAFCVVAGLGPTHHPLTAFSFPAYTLFIIMHRPQDSSGARRPGVLDIHSSAWWREKRWRRLLTMLLFGTIGLAVWLYYPIRSPMKPDFGPADMNTMDGFLNVALARGLRVNLFHFGLAEQGQRLLVFWTLLRQQFALPVIALAAVGLGWLVKHFWRLSLLLGLALFVNLAFTINTVQDVMAYLLTPFMLIALFAGLGTMTFIRFSFSFLAKLRSPGSSSQIYGDGVIMHSDTRLLSIALGFLLLIWPTANLIENLPRISLRDYQAGDDYVEAVEERFSGRGEGAMLLNDWEHMTPLWYSQFVDERQPDPTDLIPSLVSTDRPWLERVFEHLPGGPVYLSGYRREIVDAGFRLRPDGVFYQVVEPGADDVPVGYQKLGSIPDQPVEILAYHLSGHRFTAGDIFSLDLAMRAPITTSDYLIPFVDLGDMHYAFTTDSHLLTPDWQAGEVIVERFAFALPHDVPAGEYPLSVGLANLSTGAETQAVPIGALAISANPKAPKARVLDNLLANFGQRVGVDKVTVRGSGKRRSAVWDEPLHLQPGEKLDLVIQWRCLAPVEESYTVFVHLMDGSNRVWDQVDYTPLGGSTPTHLWIPKWLPGQTALDPYRLQIQFEAPSGDYYLEIGLYGMTTRQRVYQYDRRGSLVGDRLVLGPIQVK